MFLRLEIDSGKKLSELMRRGSQFACLQKTIHWRAPVSCVLRVDSANASLVSVRTSSARPVMNDP
jgi:hypothetical protein